MKTEMLHTKLDGIQPFQWWTKDDFQGRVTRFYSGNIGNMTLDKELPIPDSLIICDFCDKDITVFPVPVFRGTHALCPECYKRVVV